MAWVAPEFSKSETSTPVPVETPSASEDWIAPEFSTKKPPADQRAPQDKYETGFVVPWKVNQRTGEGSLAVPGLVTGVAEGIHSGVTLPRDVVSGAVDPMSDEGITRALDLATIATGNVGRAAARKPVLNAASTQATAQAAERLGVQVPVGVAASSIPAVKTATTIAKNIPFVGSPIIKSARHGISELSEKTAGLGGAATRRTAGKRMRKSITEFATETIKNKISKRYTKVDKLIDPAVTRPLYATRAVVKEIKAARKLAFIEGSDASNTVMSAMRQLDGLGYEGTQKLRSKIGEMIKNPGGIPEGMSQGDLKRIYGALTKDFYAVTAKSGGRKATKALAAADKYAKKRSTVRKRLYSLTKTASDEGLVDKIAKSANKNSGADSRLLAQIRRAAGDEEWNEMAASVVKGLGRDTHDEFTPTKFLADYAKKSEMGKIVLWGKTGLKQSLDDIATVSKAYDMMKSVSQPSQLAQVAVIAGVGTAILASPLTAIGHVVGARKLTNMLANPVTAKSMANWSKAYNKFIHNPTQATLAAQRAATVKLKVATTAEFGREFDVLPERMYEIQEKVY